MRHADHDLGGAVLRRFSHGGVEHRDKRIGAFDAEALLALIRTTDEAFQTIDLRESFEHGHLFGGGKLSRAMFVAQHGAEPESFRLVGQVHHFEREP